ncbi:MAG: TIGR04219 family outer membrane beta-barrel protein [Thiovulaceae bacterium]|nr:TIGR04219 family outer membrane beta-barrel protein [Sulfurimonadaceae bacterium]
MIKKLLSVFLVATTFATVIYADLSRVEVGVGSWNQEPSSTTLGTTTTLDKENDIYVWAYAKHPVPVIPNLRLEYVTATATTSSISSIEFAQIDVIPYYNILDNTAWITLDLGLDFKSISATSTLVSVETTDDFLLPMGYLRTRFQLPLSGLGAEADVKYIAYSDNTVYDARIKIDYTFDITPIIQPGLEVGYRVQKIETDELFGVDLNYEFSGIYAGLMLRF